MMMSSTWTQIKCGNLCFVLTNKIQNRKGIKCCLCRVAPSFMQRPQCVCMCQNQHVCFFQSVCVSIFVTVSRYTLSLVWISQRPSFCLWLCSRVWCVCVCVPQKTRLALSDCTKPVIFQHCTEHLFSLQFKSSIHRNNRVKNNLGNFPVSLLFSSEWPEGNIFGNVWIFRCVCV